MEKRTRISDKFTAWKRRLQRARLECRECEVICERVVSPQHCLDSECSAVYAYDDDGTQMFGCLHKVFAPDLDMAAFKQGRGRSGVGGIYGALRLNRPPRKQCKITVEQGYPALAATTYCSNPTFFHLPTGSPEERIRFTRNLPPDPQAQD